MQKIQSDCILLFDNLLGKLIAVITSVRVIDDNLKNQIKI